MVKKSILSAVTAVAVLTTGSMAFDVIEDGTIVTKDFKVSSAYDKGVVTGPELKLSATQKGDALIFPAFKQSTATTDADRMGWETEAVIRNNSDKAVIAKVTFHAAADSQEIFDFNIYLSGHDAFRFTMKDGNVITTDGSIVDNSTLSDPQNGSLNDEAEMNVDGVEYQINQKTITVDSGYFTVIAMAEADKDYHKNHKGLYLDYRTLLDECRPEWRDAYYSGIETGVVIFNKGLDSDQVLDRNDSIASPNVSEACDNPATKYMNADFFDPRPEVLMGTLRLYNPLNDKRDLVIPATAISNMTDCNTTAYAVDNGDATVSNCALTNRPDQRADGTMMLYLEAELGNLADRNILAGKYIESNVRKDAETFLVTYADYSYDNSKLNSTAKTEKADNTLLVTQPFKRTLIQLGNDDKYWELTDTIRAGVGTFEVPSSFSYSLWDEAERNCATNDNLYVPTSPYTSTDSTSSCTKKYPDELAVLNNLQDLADNTPYFQEATTRGFAKVPFLGAAGKGIPAVVTQMIGTEVGGEAQANWIYASVDRPVIAEEKTTYFRGYDFESDDAIKTGLDYIDGTRDFDLRNVQNNRDVLVTRENSLDNVPSFDADATVK